MRVKIFLVSAVMVMLFWPITADVQSLSPSQVNVFSSQTGIKLGMEVVESGCVIMKEYSGIVKDADKFNKIISMDRNFAKNVQVKVKFTQVDEVKLLLPKIDKLALLGIKEGKWVLKNIKKGSEWD